MRLEIIAAPLIFFILLGMRRFGHKALSVPFAVLLGLSFIGDWNRAIGEPGSFGQIYAFIAGMAAALRGRAIVEALKRPQLWLVAIVILFAVTRPVIGWSSYWTILFETILGSALIALLAFGPQHQAPPRVMRFYGRISFSFYLLHPLSLIVLQHLTTWTTQAVQSGYHPIVLAAALLVASVVVITPLAWLQYRFVETTGIALGKRLQRRRHRHAAYQSRPLEKIAHQPDTGSAPTGRTGRLLQ